MFRHYRVIFRELVFIISPSHISISIVAVMNTSSLEDEHDSVETCSSVIIYK